MKGCFNIHTPPDPGSSLQGRASCVACVRYYWLHSAICNLGLECVKVRFAMLLLVSPCCVCVILWGGARGVHSVSVVSWRACPPGCVTASGRELAGAFLLHATTTTATSRRFLFGFRPPSPSHLRTQNENRRLDVCWRSPAFQQLAATSAKYLAD